jgi:hypothetical protein
MRVFSESPPNQAPHVTGAAILVPRGMKVLQAAPAGELGRCPDDGSERVGERWTAQASGCLVAVTLWRIAV